MLVLISEFLLGDSRISDLLSYQGIEESVLVSCTWPFLAKINVIFLQTAKFSYTNYILRYWKIATGLVHKYIEPLYNGLEPDSIYNLYSLNPHSIWKTTMTLLVP